MNDEEGTREALVTELRRLRRRVKVLEEAVGEAPAAAAETTQALGNAALMVGPDAFRKMFLDHGAVMYVVDLSTFAIIDANRAALDFYGYDLDTMLTKRIPDLNTTPEAEIRAEIKRAVAEGRAHYVFQHQIASGEIRDVEVYANPISIRGKEYSFSIVHDITEHKKADRERERLIADLQSALEEIKTLRGIIPICSFCKRVRDDQGFWRQVEVYVTQHSEAGFSHSLCPECVREQYPELYE